MTPDWSEDDPRLTPILLRRELVARGYSDVNLRSMLRDGSLDRARRGAYVAGPPWRAMDPVQRCAVRTRAVLRAAAADVVVSHGSAAIEWDLPLWGVDVREVHLTHVDQRGGRVNAGIRPHNGTLVDDDVVERNGLRVTSPVRTVLDLTAAHGSEVGLVVANAFAHRGLLELEQLRERYERGSSEHRTMARWPGAQGTQIVLLLVDPRIESVAESRLQHLLWRYNYPRPEPQWSVHNEAGVEIARLDFALPKLKAWINIDGVGKYADQIAAGRSPASLLVAEKDLDQIVAERTGWRGHRLRWPDLERPGVTCVRLDRFLYGPASSSGASA